LSGRFITFEGIDGSGKTTVAGRVTAALRSRGVDAVFTQEPTETWLGEAVKRCVAEKRGALVETFLFLADRAEHSLGIRAWLAEGKTVVCDRYADSTYAYQGVRLAGLVPDPVEWLQAISRPFVLTPDLTILLRVDPATGLRRLASRAHKAPFEEETFLKEVAEVFDRLATDVRFETVDANADADAVVAAVLEALDRRLYRK
jgi:dTMP kinase